MKQHITQEQVASLSHTARLQLAEWSSTRLLEGPAEFVTLEEGAWVRVSLPLLSIAQMLNFLVDHDKAVLFPESSMEEFCDMVWERVKRVLEEGRTYDAPADPFA